jgi:hypothetical protein
MSGGIGVMLLGAIEIQTLFRVRGEVVLSNYSFTWR